ncbi:MAG: transcriptional repressor LexA [Candidatus Moranbacteria bacterium]|nr:transcriptional repressor LexA [Candidatus Moranbacteria bacterium]
MATLTKRQKQILDFITEYIKKNTISPTIKEIKKHFRLSALSTVHQHVETLKEKGFLEKNGSSARGLEIKQSKKTNNFIRVPILGNITAGKPIEAIEEKNGSLKISISEIEKSAKYYALRVIGESMKEEGIFDGDMVVIKKQAVAENGQTIVAIIDDNQATLKKIYRDKNRFRLQPANQAMLPIFRKEVEIRGVVVKIIRNFENMDISNKQKLFRTLDLFAGVGGIRLGFEKAGFETVFANDFEKKCKETYDLNFNTSKLIVEDIRKIGIDDLPEFDFLLGGFPCQAFSIAGHRKGFKDEKGRGNLFFDIARIIKAKEPMGFLLENVKNLRGHDEGRTFTIIMQELKNLGYHVKSKVLNSMEYGNIPQNRERIYIVGFKNKNYCDKFEFPEAKKLKIKVIDLLEKNVDEKYYYNNKPLYLKLKNVVKETGKVYQWRRQYVRENKKGVCPTLTANMGMGGHNVPIIKDRRGIRKLTPLECFRIQGFPKSFALPKNLVDSALYKQAGNSVTVTVIEAIAREIKKAITD